MIIGGIKTKNMICDYVIKGKLSFEELDNIEQDKLIVTIVSEEPEILDEMWSETLCRKNIINLINCHANRKDELMAVTEFCAAVRKEMKYSFHRQIDEMFNDEFIALQEEVNACRGYDE